MRGGGGGRGTSGAADAVASNASMGPLGPAPTTARPGDALGSGPGLTVDDEEPSSRLRDRRNPRGDADRGGAVIIVVGAMVGMGEATDADADADTEALLLLLLDRSLKDVGDVEELLWV